MKKNTLQYILLGLIEQKGMSGYDLKEVFKNEIGEFWQAEHSQIYPTLKKLEEKGWISSTITIVGTKLEKKVYSITPLGKEQVNDWLFNQPNELASFKDEFILKLYFIKENDQQAIQDILTEQQRLHRLKLEHLYARREVIFPGKKALNGDIGHYLILDHAINREQCTLTWIERTLASLPLE